MSDSNNNNNVSHEDMTSLSYFDHSSGKRVNTDIVLVEAIRSQYPNLDLVVAPQGRLNLLAYAGAGHATATPLEDVVKDPVYGPGLNELIKDATKWGSELHNEVWVFDGGYWQKSAELYNSVQKSSWESVILDEDMKKALISDVENFFDGQQT